MIRSAALALTLGLSACSISAGLPRASFTASRGTAPPGPSGAVPTETRFKSWRLRLEQLRPLIGRPVAEVKQRLRALGHVGGVRVLEDVAPTATCHGDLVCAFDQDGYDFEEAIRVSLAIPPGAE